MIRVVGSVVMDLISRAPQLPAPGETVIGKSAISVRVGGKGLNQAVQAAKALKRISPTNITAMVGFEGCVGSDAFGRAAIRELEQNIVKHHLLHSKDVGTGTGSVHCRSTDGENCIVVCTGANMLAERWDDFIEYSPFVDADIVIGQLELPFSATLQVFRSVKAGSLRILNAAPAPLSSNKHVDDILGLSEIIVVNESEAEALRVFDSNASLGTRYVISSRCRNAQAVIVTLGSKGARLITREGKLVEIPATDDIAVDTVGAGDCFTGTLAANLLLRTGSLERCLIQANQAAGKYVSEPKKEMSLQEALLGR